MPLYDESHGFNSGRARISNKRACFADEQYAKEANATAARKAAKKLAAATKVKSHSDLSVV